MSKEQDKLELPQDNSSRVPPGSGNQLDAGSKEALASDVPATLAAIPRIAELVAGQVIAGRYKLIEIIGEGGMGSVWMAEQREPVRRLVALKLIKPGMDSRAVVVRFEAERQALALMDHPNIAKVLDGGVAEDGRPYFVMELIKGLPITKFCDERRLTPHQRLALFIPVCQAIQHAHQKGIIHRDIKPGNVLVALYDDHPVPKVIDFGVAKAVGGLLTDQTLHTGFGAVLGTINYMSPEQATLNNLDIDTRSDVYSLGALLYELLAGTPPFRRDDLREAGMLEILRIVREDDPPRPSNRFSTSKTRASVAAARNVEPDTLTRIMQSDLDWVVMKALEKDRVRRYQTAAAFGLDLQRYLQSEPVQARPQSLAYQLQKFVRKRKGLVAALATIAALMILATTTSIGQAIRANSARRDADSFRKAADAEKSVAVKERERADSEAENARLEKAEADSARKLAESRLYAQKIRLALSEWEHGDPGVAIESLESTSVGERGWEYQYLRNRFDRLHVNMEPQVTGVDCIAVSHRGGLLASGGQDNCLSIWDPTSRSRIRTLSGHTKRVAACAFSPDDSNVATGSFDHSVKIWDVDSGRELRSLVGHSDHASALAYSSNGDQLATGGWDNLIILWDPQTGTEIGRLIGHEGQVYGVTFSADGKRLASCGQDGTVRLWDVAERKETRVLRGHSDQVFEVRFSPDGKSLASASADRTIKIWDVESGAEISTLTGHTDWVSMVAYSNDGRRIASCGFDKTIRIWDLAQGKLLGTLKGHVDAIADVAFLPDSRRLVSAGFDGIKLWDPAKTETGDALSGHKFLVTGIDFSPDNKQLVSGSLDGTIQRWNVSEKKAEVIFQQPEERLSCVVYSKDGRRFAVGSESGVIRVWNSDGEEGPTVIDGFAKPVNCLAFGPTSSELYAGCGDGSIVVCAVATQSRRNLFAGHTKAVTGIAVFGELLVSSSGDRSICVWDLTSGKKRLTLSGHEDQVTCCAISPDGQLVASGSLDGTVRTWRVSDGRPLGQLNFPEKVFCLAFSPDGRRIASGSYDRLVSISDISSLETILSLRGHEEWVSGVRFSPDGTHLATCSFDATIRLW